MSDDWRLRIELRERRRAFELARALEAAELEHDLATGFPERVALSRDGSEVFCYASSREQAERARGLIEQIAQREGWEVESELRRWHPIAEEWEDPDAPLPASAAERRSEREELVEREREEAGESGAPDFEIRVECRTHRDALELADRLATEGIPFARRWRYLVIGASDEDSAQALVERIRAESPPGSILTTEGTERAVRAATPFNPFSLFGGLGV